MFHDFRFVFFLSSPSGLFYDDAQQRQLISVLNAAGIDVAGQLQSATDHIVELNKRIERLKVVVAEQEQVIEALFEIADGFFSG